MLLTSCEKSTIHSGTCPCLTGAGLWVFRRTKRAIFLKDCGQWVILQVVEAKWCLLRYVEAPERAVYSTCGGKNSREGPV